jgi:uroporphyrinogen III methyltransferase/synthase
MNSLAGKGVVVTRSPHQAGPLVSLLSGHGALPLLYPCVDIVPPADKAPFDAALHAAHTGAYTWLALTSANAVWAVARRLAELGLAQSTVQQMHLAAIGPATAAAAREALQMDATIIPSTASGAALAQALSPLADGPVLLPVSSLAEVTVASVLDAQGASVTRVVAYETTVGTGGVDLPLLVEQGAVQAITLTSSSAATNLTARVLAEGGDGALLRLVAVACIGDRTADTARAQGLHVVAVPQEHTLVSLVASLDDYFGHEAATAPAEGNQ